MTPLESSAMEAAEEARILFNAGRYSGACSRAYYAMFNAARAMLVARGHSLEEVKTHKSVLRLFSLEFVQDGSVDAEDGRSLRRTADTRHAADYEGGVTREEAVRVMASLERFMVAAVRILETNSKG